MSVNLISGLYISRNLLSCIGFLLILSSLVSGSSKNSDPIIIILGPPGSAPGGSSSSGPMGQIESVLSDRDSSGSISRSSFNFFRPMTDKKDDKKGPHIIFIGGTATSPMNNNANNGGGNGPMQGPPNVGSLMGGPNGDGPGMNSFIGNGHNNINNNNGFGPNPSPNLPPGPMRRGQSGPGISVTGANNYGPYPITSGVNSGSMAPNYPYIPYVMGGYNSPTSYPTTGYDYTDYSWPGWRR